MLHEEPLQRIDFQRSDLRWITRNEKSHGAFKIVAVLRLRPTASAPPTLFALGAAVLAGNMYVDGGLVKEPPYMFQVVVGVSDHVIFRTDLSHGWLHSMRNLFGLRGARPAVDTVGPNGQRFECLEMNIEVEPAQALVGYAEIAGQYSQRNYFTGLITIDLATSGKLELEFPINHLNLLPSRAMWQLETGPVLFVKEDPAPLSTRDSVGALLPCFVHSNRSDRAEFTPDFPFSGGTTPRSANAKISTFNCQVQLLASSK